MKKKSHSIFAVLALALVIAAAIVVFALIRKYTPSKEHEDLTTYYHLTNSEEVAIVLNNEVTSSKARVIDGHIYIDYDFVHDNLNSRFYWDNNENILLYATTQNLISAQAEQTSYMVTKSSADYGRKIVTINSDTAYIDLDFVKSKGKETVTADGEKLMLFGNIGKPEDASQVLINDGEGIGLFRTEFLFMGASKLPTEEEQFAAYKQAAEIMAGKSVIIRTLDVGGDKDIPYLGLEKEDNPFLGFRAVRYCLKNEDVYKVQLRALLRASAFGDVKIMIPLVTCVEEVRAVKALVKKLMAELDAEGRKYNKDIEIGVMIETPAASLIADLLAKEADFFSIGTNDLTQYTMAVDRGNARVSYLYSAYNPAVLRSMKHIIETGKAAGITVGMCGEAAADPLLIPLLVSFGLEEYSVSATSVLATRGILSKWSKKEADELAEKALSLSTEAEVAELLKEAQK